LYLHLYVYFIGKPRDVHANAMAEEFIKRTTRYARCEMREIKTDRVEELWTRHKSGSKILLDPAGRVVESAWFTSAVAKAEREGRDLIFLIGGASGLPASLKPRADALVSLSPLTFPHELARVVLAEQIYRAVTTLRGHPYPR
jgi:23S rRNA (pseudouridine1915-N3)-methyltransferase